MSRVKKFLRKYPPSGGQTSRDQQPSDIQQPGGGHGQQPSNRQPQLQECDSSKRSSKAGSKAIRSASEATTIGHAGPPSQSDTITANDTPAPASGRIMALPEFYAAVIVFVIKARQYFEARWLKKAVDMLKPFAIEFQLFIDDITGKEKVVQECANMATMERIRRSSEKIARMENLLIDMQTKMKPLFQLNDALAENVKVSKEILKCSLDTEDGQLLQLLSTLEPLSRHADIRSIRLENTGTWLLELECFRKWCDIQSTDRSERILCCYGMLGAGKTVISSLVIDYLCSQVTRRTTSQASIVCLYADYREQDKQTLVNILASFLHQFLTSASLLHIPDQVIKTLREVKKRNTKVEVGDVLAMLKLILEQLDGSYFCIDALDELEIQTRRKLLDILSNIQLGTKTMRLFFTGRPHMQSEVQNYFEIRQEQEVKIIANENDIRQYLRHKIAEDRRANPDTMNEVLENEILSALVTRSQGMFLLPALHSAMVLEKATISKRRKALKNLPTELNDTFGGVIKRIQQSRAHAELGMKVLLWLHLAYQPLKLEELQHALAVEKDDSYFEVDNIPSRKTILDCCFGLVQIDEETMTVRFVHYTLEEYFRHQSSVHFPNGYSDIAETCLIYLSFPEIREHCKLGSELNKKTHDFPFLKYAACNWGIYAKHQSNETVVKLALTLFADGNKLPSTPLQVLYASIANHWDFKYQYHIALLFSGIHVGAFFGLDDLTQCYCEMGQADLHDNTGRSPLSWAAGRGHEAVVRLLLERNDVDANAKDNRYGQTPLSWAAGNGHGAVVRLLLERNDVDIDAKDEKYGWSPLSWAAKNGHKAVVRLLLEQNNVDVNAKDEEYGQTPLSWAAENGYEAVVRLLLEQNDVDVNAKDKKYGRSPLSWAAKNGREAAVQVLLERNNVNVNLKDNSGQSPLSWAAKNGHEAVVRLLLSRNDVDVNAKDEEYGQTPLSWAAENGHEAVVRLLLEQNNVDIDAKDEKYGRSPLSWAAKNGREAAVQVLLERNNVNVNLKDNSGQSPLSWAAKNGHEAVVRLLLSRNDVDVNAKDEEYGETPLSWAAENGHEAVVRLLLEQNDVDVNAKDKKYGRSPLSWAAKNGRESAVQVLLERNNVNVNLKDNSGQSPLSWAAKNGHEAVVRLLLSRNDVDVNAKDEEYGETPLSWAAENGHEAVVRLLLEQNNVDVNAKDKKYGRSPLSWAAKNGRESAVQVLLERNNVNVNLKDNSGQSPLSWAAKNGHEGVVRLLLSRNDVDVNAKDEEYGQTPLSWAAENGHEAVVRLLLEQNNVDVNAKDEKYGRSPLSWAAKNGREAAVQVLLERNNVNVNVKDNSGRSPLSWAAENGHEAVVRLLVA
ncbi:ankyrin repeat-containing domain protein [Tirmania nivea]|nr:ankyrin repeat-containing domain protein [Tirmania nivea]